MPTWASVVIALAGAVPGVFALFGSAVWIGRTNTRLLTVERDLRDLKDIKSAVAMIEERTKNTQADMSGVAGDIRRITDHFLDESRSFARALVKQGQDKPRPS